DLGETADSLAHATSVQQAFQTRNRAALVRLARTVPDAAFYINDQLIAGEAPHGLHVERTSSVLAEDGSLIGSIAVWFPLDGTLLAQLRAVTGLGAPDRILLAQGGEVLAGPDDIVGSGISPLPQPNHTHLV